MSAHNLELAQMGCTNTQTDKNAHWQKYKKQTQNMQILNKLDKKTQTDKTEKNW